MSKIVKKGMLNLNRFKLVGTEASCENCGCEFVVQEEDRNVVEKVSGFGGQAAVMPCPQYHSTVYIGWF